MAKNRVITVQGIPVTVSYEDIDDYICITDIAAAKSDNSRAADVIRNWLRNRSTLEFLSTWEEIYNPNFKVFESEHFKKEAGLVTFTPSVSEWVEKTNAVLKHIHFRFPVYYNGTVIDDISWENESTVETVVLLSKGAKGPVDLCSARTEVERRMADSRKVKVDFSLEDMDLSEFKGKATYEQIKAYVLEKTGLMVSSLYIAQIKKKCGLDVGENFNPAKSENARQPQCTPEKEDAIMQAFRHFGII